MHHIVVRAVCITLASSVASLSPSPLSAEERPNLVIIFADDLGYGDVACFGHPRHHTPHLDRMAAEGARLTNLHVPTPYCAPSRGTILTGRYPWRHGVWKNPAPDGGVNDVGLPDEEVTLAEALRPAGYATACIGKWHLGPRPEFYPRRHGFDEYYGILYSNDMRPVQLIENEEVVEYPVVQATLTQRYTARALDFMERHGHQPFFLYLAHAMPHKPLAVSETFYKQSGSGLYADVIQELDAGIGAVLQKIQSLGLDERTLVLFTSDNGPWYGGDTAGLRGMKGTAWEGGLRVPGIVRWPGRIPPGQTLDAPCGTVDVLPTLLAAAGVPLPEGRPLDGINLLDYLTGGDPPSERPLYGMSGERLMTVQRGRYKLHVVATRAAPLSQFHDRPDEWVDPRGPDGVTLLAPYEQARPDQFPGLLTGDPPRDMMLFDLVADVGEQHDVAAAHPDVVRQLTADFNRALETLPAELRGRNPPR